MKYQVVLLLVVSVAFSQAIPLALQKRMSMLLDRMKEEHLDDHDHSDIGEKLDRILKAMCKMDPTMEYCPRVPSLEDQVEMLQQQVIGIEAVVESLVKQLAKIEGGQFMKDMEEEVKEELENVGLGDMDMSMESESEDTGTPTDDAGILTVGAGTQTDDAGTLTVDAGTQTEDSGTQTETTTAGTTTAESTTAGTTTADGTGNQDATTFGINLPGRRNYGKPPIDASLDKKALRDRVLSMLSKQEIRELEEITERKLANNLLSLLKEKKEKREENHPYIY